MPRIDDVEILLFDVDEPGHLPDAESVAELRELASVHELTYTVHLPLDLRLVAAGPRGRRSVDKASRVIEATAALDPCAWIVHLEPPVGEGSSTGAGGLAAWVERAVAALARLGEVAGGAAKLAVENLGSDDAEIELVSERLAVARCVDIGHLWRDGVAALPALRRALPRVRVIHLHAVADRDHRSLLHADPGELRRVIALLLDAGWQGVLTLEVFDERDLCTSMQTLAAMLRG